MGKLSDNERKVITERIRGLRLEHMHAGISTQSMVICDNCRKVQAAGRSKPVTAFTGFARVGDTALLRSRTFPIISILRNNT